MGKQKRAKQSGRFSQLPHALQDQWMRLGLSVGGRSLHMELIRRFKGNNNGEIYLSCREASRMLCVSKNTAATYFHALEELGFIVKTQEAYLGFDGQGKATKWRLTHLPYQDRIPTHDYKLKPDNNTAQIAS